MKIEKSRRVVESRPVCMDLYLRIRMEFFTSFVKWKSLPIAFKTLAEHDNFYK